MKNIGKYLTSGLLIAALGLGTTLFVKSLAGYSNRRFKSLESVISLHTMGLLRRNPTNFSIRLVKGRDDKNRVVIYHRQFGDEAHILKKKNDQIDFVPTTPTTQNLEQIIDEERNLIPKGENIEEGYIDPNRLIIDLATRFSKDLDTAILSYSRKQYLVTYNEDGGLQVRPGRQFLYLKGYNGQDIFRVNPTNYRIKLVDIDGSGKAAVVLHHKDSEKIYGIMEKDNEVKLKPLSVKLSDTKQLPDIADLREGYVSVKNLSLLLDIPFLGLGKIDSDKAILEYGWKEYPLRHKNEICELR